MHVAVEQAGHQPAPTRLDDLSRRANGELRLRPDVGDATLGDGNVRLGDDLTRLDAHPTASSKDDVSRGAPHGDIYQMPGGPEPVSGRHRRPASIRWSAHSPLTR